MHCPHKLPSPTPWQRLVARTAVGLLALIALVAGPGWLRADTADRPPTLQNSGDLDLDLLQSLRDGANAAVLPAMERPFTARLPDALVESREAGEEEPATGSRRVPEPTTVALVLLALSGLGVISLRYRWG